MGVRRVIGKIVKWWLISSAVGTVLLVVIGLSVGHHQGAPAQAAQAAAPETPTPDNPMPATEAAFIDAVARYAASYNAGSNDMTKGAERPKRAAAICAALRRSTTLREPWVGTVVNLDATDKGRGILTLRIADGITLGTVNNELSAQLGDNTLIDAGSALFAAAGALHQGQAVRFTGSFLPSDTDCVKERSLTMEGSMTEPEYAFRFVSLHPVP